MLPKKIKQQIRKGQKMLEYFDKYGELPFKRKRIDVTLSSKTVNKLKKIKEKTGKPVSRIIEESINKTAHINSSKRW